MLAEWNAIVNLKNEFATSGRMYEETRYRLFGMTARRLGAVRHNGSVPVLTAARRAALGVRLGV